ncbi:sensor histidine kinase [candidate division KSB1 bacterium]|nr:MAG: sensor histidine kinase [candidate division KSB1 bacterium]MCE7941693.1 sensor histidine kinase [Chlorobi bacterium CHB1]
MVIELISVTDHFCLLKNVAGINLPMHKRLAPKLIFSLTIIVVLVEGISAYLNTKRQEKELLDAMILGADQLSRSITSATWHAMLADHRSAAYEVMQTIALKQGIDKIRIFNKEGYVMFSTDPEDPKQVDKDAEACAMCHSSLQPLVKVDVPSRARIFRAHDGQRKLAMVTPIYNEAACSQAACHAHPPGVKVLGVLDVALNLDRVDEDVVALQRRSLLVTGIHVVLIGIFIVFFSRRFVDRPIRELIDGTRAVSAMQLDKPIEINSSEELGELANSFNLMRERLRQARAETRRFTQELEAKSEERAKQLQIAHQKLLQSDRLASLGQLSASVAHEINNPLSGVLNLSKLMQRILTDDGVPASRVQEFRRYLSQVINETARVGRIVSDLLAFSRRSKPQSKRTDLNEIVRNTISLLSHKLKLSNVEVEENLAPDLPAVRCDSSQMQQVVINLVMNGAEATQPRSQGKVIVRTSARPEEKIAVLEVEDNGEGIPPEFLSKIFDPFFTTKGEGKGVGLGLSVVYGIVEAHGGELEVNSRLGKGTVFTVTLPLAVEESTAAKVAPSLTGQPV